MSGNSDKSATASPQPAPYRRLAVALGLLLAIAPGLVFSMALATAGGPDVLPSVFVPGVFVLIAVGIWAKHLWADVLNSEPESQPTFLQKHRATKRNAAIAAAGLFAAAIAAGSYVGKALARDDTLRSLTSQAVELGHKASPLKQQLIMVAARETETMDAYVQRCADLEQVLDKYEPIEQKLVFLGSQLESHFPSDEGLTILRTVGEQDLEVLRLMRQEIEQSKQLRRLVESERARFYSSVIQPLQERQQKIANEQVELVRSALGRGVKLPKELAKLAQ